MSAHQAQEGDSGPSVNRSAKELVSAVTAKDTPRVNAALVTLFQECHLPPAKITAIVTQHSQEILAVDEAYRITSAFYQKMCAVESAVQGLERGSANEHYRAALVQILNGEDRGLAVAQLQEYLERSPEPSDRRAPRSTPAGRMQVLIALDQSVVDRNIVLSLLEDEVRRGNLDNRTVIKSLAVREKSPYLSLINLYLDALDDIAEDTDEYIKSKVWREGQELSRQLAATPAGRGLLESRLMAAGPVSTAVICFALTSEYRYQRAVDAAVRVLSEFPDTPPGPMEAYIVPILLAVLEANAEDGGPLVLTFEQAEKLRQVKGYVDSAEQYRINQILDSAQYR